MELLSPKTRLPILEVQYIIRDGVKLFKIISSKVDKILIEQLKEEKIRMQIWLERELRKVSGDIVKRSWVHSRDNTNNGINKLFSEEQYNYGGGKGWGWATMENTPPYSTTNGYVPTEHEITIDDIEGQRIIKEIPVLDIFSNILKCKGQSAYATSSTQCERLCILGRCKTTSQPLRFKLVANENHKAIFGSASNPIILGIHKDINVTMFNPNNIQQHIKVSYYK